MYLACACSCVSTGLARTCKRARKIPLSDRLQDSTYFNVSNFEHLWTMMHIDAPCTSTYIHNKMPQDFTIRFASKPCRCGATDMTICRRCFQQSSTGRRGWMLRGGASHAENLICNLEQGSVGLMTAESRVPDGVAANRSHPKPVASWGALGPLENVPSTFHLRQGRWIRKENTFEEATCATASTFTSQWSKSSQKPCLVTLREPLTTTTSPGTVLDTNSPVRTTTAWEPWQCHYTYNFKKLQEILSN